MTKPESPADPRGGEPYYINSECDKCGTALELYDPDSGWNDEWWCPECEDGIHMDWPEAEFEKLVERAQETSTISHDEMGELFDR